MSERQTPDLQWLEDAIVQICGITVSVIVTVFVLITTLGTALINSIRGPRSS